MSSLQNDACKFRLAYEMQKCRLIFCHPAIGLALQDAEMEMKCHEGNCHCTMEQRYQSLQGTKSSSAGAAPRPRPRPAAATASTPRPAPAPLPALPPPSPPPPPSRGGRGQGPADGRRRASACLRRAAAGGGATQGTAARARGEAGTVYGQRGRGGLVLGQSTWSLGPAHDGPCHPFFHLPPAHLADAITPHAAAASSPRTSKTRTPATKKLHGRWGSTPAVAGAAAPPCSTGTHPRLIHGREH
jgi:hypothetical protein